MPRRRAGPGPLVLFRALLWAGWLGGELHAGVSSSALVITEVPAGVSRAVARGAPESGYPRGSRVSLVEPPFEGGRATVLSAGLVSARDPVVSYDGSRVCFSGRVDGGGWQIYEYDFRSGRREVVTAMAGGAMEPAFLRDGGLVFVSPAVAADPMPRGDAVSALYAQPRGAAPRRLTFGFGEVSAPTLLSDGRILFVSRHRRAPGEPAQGQGLFTINNDGTELTPFAAPSEAGVRLHHPRESFNGRLAFLSTPIHGGDGDTAAESVRLANPFKNRAALLPGLKVAAYCVEPTGDGGWLVCAQRGPVTAPGAVFRVDPAGALAEAPLLTRPQWSVVEAVLAAPHPRPLGRLSSVDPSKQTGHILCLDADYSAEGGERRPKAVRVRILTEATPGVVRAIGELPVQADGSFMAEAPADVPLGFETLDAAGRVIQRDSPMMWLRPGENRSCIGCHEPPNHSPSNHRALALDAPQPRFGLGGSP